MKFPVKVKYRRFEAVIYAKSKSYRYYRLAYRAAGKRIIRSFSTYSEARQEAETKVRQLATGNQNVALSAKESADALAIRDALDSFRRNTGRSVTAIQAVTSYLDVAKLLPTDHNLADAVRGYLRTVAVVQRKSLAEAVTEFCEVRKAQTVAPPGKRPALNPVYVQDTERQLNEFAGTFQGTAVADLARTHIDAYIGAHGTLSPKSRNNLRATVRMFLGWCARHDYLPANHRLLEADGLRKEKSDGKGGRTLIGLWCSVRQREFRFCIKEAKDFLGIRDGFQNPCVTNYPAPPVKPDESARRKVSDTWAKCLPLVEGGPVWRYLVEQRQLDSQAIAAYDIRETISFGERTMVFPYWAAPADDLAAVEITVPIPEWLKFEKLARLEGKKKEWTSPQSTLIGPFHAQCEHNSENYSPT